MTEEEIRNLKVGDKFILTYHVTEISDARVEIGFNPDYGFLKCEKFGSGTLNAATLVKPAQKFEVGDTVRIIPDPMSGRIHGGHYSQQLLDREGVIESIAADDDENTMWLHVDGYDHRWGISPHCLELVKKAVKDKYEVHDHLAEFVVLCDTDPKSIAKLIVSSYNKNNRPNAEAAAKSECDLLNAEWRKQQEGGES